MKRAASKLVLPEEGRDHIRGSVRAPYKLVEYGDFQCPYCGEAHSIVQEIEERLGDQLCYAFRNFPLTEIHEHAEHAAEAAEAAGAQGKYWEMHDTLFENQEALEDEDLKGYASALGLDAERLIREVTNSAHVVRLRDDFRDGESHGVDGTPTFFVNGTLYAGEPDADALIDALTERAK